MVLFLLQVRKEISSGTKWGQTWWVCHGVSQKLTASLSHTHTLSQAIIRIIPSAKSYTYTLNKHKHISYLIKKDDFSSFSFDDSEPVHFCCLLETLEGLWKRTRQNFGDLSNLKICFSLFFLTFQELLKQWSCSKALQKTLCLRRLLLCFNGLNLSRLCLQLVNTI